MGAGGSWGLALSSQHCQQHAACPDAGATLQRCGQRRQAPLRTQMGSASTKRAPKKSTKAGTSRQLQSTREQLRQVALGVGAMLMHADAPSRAGFTAAPPLFSPLRHERFSQGTQRLESLADLLHQHHCLAHARGRQERQAAESRAGGRSSGGRAGGGGGASGGGATAAVAAARGAMPGARQRGTHPVLGFGSE